jgi:predicted HD phosphohydrolase
MLSLKLQGGRFNDAQCRRFERIRFAADAIRVRSWDDAGKVAGRPAPGLEQYWPLLGRVARAVSEGLA